jgi:hypothetical protein
MLFNSVQFIVLKNLYYILLVLIVYEGKWIYKPNFKICKSETLETG